MSKWDEIFGRKFKAMFSGSEPLGNDSSTARQVAHTTFRLFKNNCLVLPWVREKDEIEGAVEGARADLLRSWRVYQSGLGSKREAVRAEADWLAVLAGFRRNVADLNRRIAAYNLKAPSAQFRKAPLDAEREINRLRYER